MGLLHWEKRYSVGVEAVDYEHRELVDLKKPGRGVRKLLSLGFSAICSRRSPRILR